MAKIQHSILRFAALVSLLLLTGCDIFQGRSIDYLLARAAARFSAPAPQPPAVLPTGTIAPTKIVNLQTRKLAVEARITMPGATATLTPTLTPTLPATEIPIPLSTRVPGATFVPAKAITRTPADPAQCPTSSEHVTVPDFQSFKSLESFEKTVIDLLNAGGVEQLTKTLKGVNDQDITGDSVPELIISHTLPPNNLPLEGKLYIFGCQDGRYKTLLRVNQIYEYAPGVTAIQDINLDGVKELVTDQLTCHYCTGMRAFEWDGQQFQSLVRSSAYTDEQHYNDVAELPGYSTASIADIDHNGTYELVLGGGAPSWLGGLSGGDGPYRAVTIIYMWDGYNFVFHSREYAPPVFRFQAVQDGDNATNLGKYDKALTLYQDAIFSDQLKSWTREVWYQLVREKNSSGSFKYPDANRMPFNQTEYDQVAAYARYRIMLLHLLRGYDGDAKTVYETLQRKFPQGNAGYPYVEMATAFWDKYQQSKSLNNACQKAIDYASAHPKILEPLGSVTEHGILGGFYKPESVCPLDILDK